MTALLDTGFLLAYWMLMRNFTLQAIVLGELVIERTTIADLARTIEILEKYADSRIDFVDCGIAAIAERLEIVTILTVDHRHFQLFRPKHSSHFEVLPRLSR